MEEGMIELIFGIVAAVAAEFGYILRLRHKNNLLQIEIGKLQARAKKKKK